MYKVNPFNFIKNLKNLINGEGLSYADINIVEFSSEQLDYFNKKIKIPLDGKCFIAGGMALDVFSLGKYPANDIDLYTDADTCDKIVSEIKFDPDVQFIYSGSLMTVSNSKDMCNVETPKIQFIILPKFANKKNITHGEFLPAYKKDGSNMKMYNDIKSKLIRYVSLYFYIYDFNVCKIAIVKIKNKYYFYHHITFDTADPHIFDILCDDKRIEHYKKKGFTDITTRVFYKEGVSKNVKTHYRQNSEYTSVKYIAGFENSGVKFTKGRTYLKIYDAILIHEINGSLLCNTFLTRYGFSLNVVSKYVSSNIKIIDNGIGEKFNEKKRKKYIAADLIDTTTVEVISEKYKYLIISAKETTCIIEVTHEKNWTNETLMMCDIKNIDKTNILSLIETLKKVYTDNTVVDNKILFTYEYPLVIVKEFMNAFTKL